MKSNSSFSLLLLFLLPLLPLLASCSQGQVYIVYLGDHNEEKTLQEIDDIHNSYLLSVKETQEEAKASLVYSYKHTFNGFAAVLSPQEAARLSEREEVVSVFRSNPRKYRLQTTRSWDFSGLNEGTQWKQFNKEGILKKAGYGEDVIVGVLDSGVWPDSKSFNDEGMGSIPKSWKGICQTGDAFNSSNCNKKLIGARYYLKGFEQYYGPLNTTLDYKSPRDKDGHGTHTSSTVAGRTVANASALGGFARGTASGGAPLARLAIYKVCWAIPGQGKENGNTCFDEDMLAAMDDAVADGVDVLSISIVTSTPTPFEEDSISIGALHAVKKNVVVACSAGNMGPDASTLSNPPPWIITVAASSLDRAFVAPVVLGNGMRIEGESVSPYHLEGKMYPLVYAAQVVNSNVPNNYIAGQCMPGALSPEKTKGKIVFCLRGNGTRVGKGMEVKRAGGAGFVLGNSPANGKELAADVHFLPATGVDSDNAIKILKYINSTRNPTANIVPAVTMLHRKPAPYMASFSSRGPNTIFPDILKPDITAPGLNILAAWSGGSSPTKMAVDDRVVEYNIESGTSMSCPHVAAAAALLKAVHPRWSSAAIRSALMTTAWQRNNMGNPITDAAGNRADPFQFGSGHFRPAIAADPGLVYDATYTDYLRFICTKGLKPAGNSTRCPRNLPPAHDLNYPSVAIPKLNGTVVVRRSVTNVGTPKSVYMVSVEAPRGFSVKISPVVLHFKKVGETRVFRITVTAERKRVGPGGGTGYVFGSYNWNDGIHNVRSPIAIGLA